ncbi:MAG: hypothetical protein JW943_12165 [Deltaproteobacteria bacterium]|nr:hypothetical protein [Deltaproteobacteria bacterium]
MKRFWLGLLSFGLLMAFCTTAFAADVKFSGDYYLQGWYNKNASLLDKDSPVGPATTASYYQGRGSTAFYTQRVRMGANFTIAKGLTLGTRFDALERKWMAARRTVPTGSPGYGATDSEAENIAFDTAYVRFATPFGFFTIGNIPGVGFGTAYGDNPGFSSAALSYGLPTGPFYFSFSVRKLQEGYTISTSYPQGTPIGSGTDNDGDSYTLTASYRMKTGGVGASYTSIHAKNTNYPVTTTPNTYSYNMYANSLSFYGRQKFGKLYIEDEFSWIFGKVLRWNEPKPPESLAGVYYLLVEKDAKNAFSNHFHVNVDMNPVLVGFRFVYSRGDDPETEDKMEGGFRSYLDVDKGFNPCLILFDQEYNHWMVAGGKRSTQTVGALIGNTNSLNSVKTYVQNVWLYQLYGKFTATSKLSFDASFTYAHADQLPTHNNVPTWRGGKKYLDKEYGKELDLTMKYKIYDNLEYMIGAAYLWTGDYFKGFDPNAKLSDTYLITHKLTLTF